MLAIDPDAPRARAAFVVVARARWGLSPAGARALWHTTRGHTARKELARVLGVADLTARDHRQEVYRRLRARGADHAVTLAWPVYREARGIGRATGG